MTFKSAAVLIASIVLQVAPVSAAGVPSIAIKGEPEVAFSYSRDHCDDIDIPDQPLRAFRKVDGSIVAIASHYVNRALLGRSFNNLRHSCHILYRGENNSSPRSFNNRTWLSALWTDDGINIAALGHNEYHGDEFRGACTFQQMEPCWYNSITMIESNDEGKSFQLRSEIPILASPNTAGIDQGKRTGYFDPSNILSLGPFKYLLVAQRGFGKENDGRCLLRNKNPRQLDGWEIYTANGFVRSVGNPYVTSYQHPLCLPVSGLGGTLGTIVRIRGTNLVAAFTIVTGAPTGDFLQVFFSQDLIDWKEGPKLLRLSAFWSKWCDSGFRYSYPSVVDDESTGRNFEDIGNSAWLFLVRGNCKLDMARDLIRYRIVIH